MAKHLSILFISVILFSCAKYEDGPAFSVRSKKERISNTWEIDKVLIDGIQVSSDFSRFKFDFSNDNSAIVSYLIDDDELVEYFGSWSLLEEDQFQYAVQGDSLGIQSIIEENWKIRRLKEVEFWIYNEDLNVEVQLKPF